MHFIKELHRGDPYHRLCIAQYTRPIRCLNEEYEEGFFISIATHQTKEYFLKFEMSKQGKDYSLNVAIPIPFFGTFWIDIGYHEPRRITSTDS